ncbi:serine protease [Candidatus Woesearchaeota archaeon]|nr:serine protease [Candidatus Woesearchaeota archaeon]
MSLKSKLVNALTVGTICFSYLATAAAGWYAHDVMSLRAEILQMLPENKKQKKEGLEEILEATEKLVNVSTYEFEYFDMKGNKTTEEKELCFVGSAFGVYKNLEEKTMLFLSCDHVTASPEQIVTLGMKEKAGKSFYEGTVKAGDSELSYVATKPVAKPGFRVGIGRLKSKKLGLFRKADYDKNGRAKKVYIDAVTELADTDASERGRDFIYNDDLTLLKLDEKAIRRYNAWDGKWADAKTVKPGQKVYAVGYPLDLSKQVTQGIITSEGDPHRDYDDNFYFTSAQINPGNSGGGVWRIVKDEDGKEKLELVGISRLKFYADGIGGIVKIGKIKDFLRKEGYSYIYRK